MHNGVTSQRNEVWPSGAVATTGTPHGSNEWINSRASVPQVCPSGAVANLGTPFGEKHRKNRRRVHLKFVRM